MGISAAPVEALRARLQARTSNLIGSRQPGRAGTATRVGEAGSFAVTHPEEHIARVLGGEPERPLEATL